MSRLPILLAATSALALAACETPVDETAAEAPLVAEAETATSEVIETVNDAVGTAETAETDMVDTLATDDHAEMVAADKLAAVLAAQPDDVQARYDQRNPAETLAFFGIEPGMTVAEGLPGGGWYTKILLGYVGEEGKVIGAHYPDPIWAKFQPDNAEWQAERIEATANWPNTAAEWAVEGAASIGSYTMTAAPEDLKETVDAVLFIRALHNLHRFNADTGWFDDTLAETFALLKPGGVVGVVQHRAPEANADAWAAGNAGYLKQSRVIAAFEAAGFVLDGSSEINANPADTPTEEDVVWRLSPSTATTEEGTPEREAIEAIGESDRMTLLFRKPV